MPGGYLNTPPKKPIAPAYEQWMRSKGLDPNAPYTRTVGDIRHDIAIDNAKWSPGITGGESALTPREIAETNEQQRLYGPGSPYYEQVGATRAGGIGSLGLTADTAATQRARDYWRPMTIEESRARNAAQNPLPPYAPQQGVPKSPAGDVGMHGPGEDFQPLNPLYVVDDLMQQVGQPGAPNPQQFVTQAAVLGPDGKLLPDPQREQAVQANIARAMSGEGMAPGPGVGKNSPTRLETGLQKAAAAAAVNTRLRSDRDGFLYPDGQMYGNMPQPPAAGQSASGTLTPEQMQQMSSPSPDARRYDGLNYKSNRVVGQSRAVSGGMAGNFVGDRQRQAISQMTSMANRMAEGRGGEPMRQGVAALEMAIQSGDTSAIESAEANLRTLLSPMLDKFDARFRGEVGDIGIDVRDQFMQTLKARIQAGTAGLNRGMPMQPQASAGTGGPRPPAPQRPGAGGQAAPQQPIRTPSGLTVHEFGSMEDAMSSSAKGGTIKSGDMVRIAGSNYTAVPAYDQYGNPEWSFVPAVVFGGGSTGSPEVAIPDPFKEGMTPEEWGDSLSEIQRQTMIDSLLTNPAMRSALDRDTLNKVDAIRRSRQGLLRSPMSPRDREAAMARLKSEENAALFAAMGVVASKGRGAALFASDFADQQRARAQADAQIESDRKLEMDLRLAECKAIIDEQKAEEAARRAAEADLRKRTLDAIEAQQKAAVLAEQKAIEDLGVPTSAEAALAYVESGTMVQPKSSPAVASAWNRLDDEQKKWVADRLLSFARSVKSTAPRMTVRSSGGKPAEGEQDVASSDGPISLAVQSRINPERYLPEQDLLALFDAARNMPTPPSPTMQQTDPDDPTKEFEQSSMIAGKEYEAKLSEWENGVERILRQGRPPQYSAEYYRENPDAVTMVQNRFNDWDTTVFRPAVDAAKESTDPAQLREALGDLYSWVVVMENAGLPTNYQNYQGIDMNNGREAFVRSVMKAMPASN